MKLYGRSLSFCVQDILAGKVKLEDVQCIITSTKLESFEDLEQCIKDYTISYWYEYFPERAKAIVWYLWFTGRIIQPRLINDGWMHDIREYQIWDTSIRDCVNNLKYL